MAIPQCAMAQVGSCFATSRKVSRVLSYWKECSSATARLNVAETCGEHEVANWTEPISSSLRLWWWPSSAQDVPTSRKKPAIRTERNRIKSSEADEGGRLGSINHG